MTSHKLTFHSIRQRLGRLLRRTVNDRWSIKIHMVAIIDHLRAQVLHDVGVFQ